MGIYHFHFFPEHGGQNPGSREGAGPHGIPASRSFLVLIFDHQRAQNPKETLGISPGWTFLGLNPGAQRPEGSPLPCPVRALTGARLQLFPCFVRRHPGLQESWTRSLKCEFQFLPHSSLVSASYFIRVSPQYLRDGATSPCHLLLHLAQPPGPHFRERLCHAGAQDLVSEPWA